MKLFALLVIVATSAFGFDAKKEFTTNCATCHSIGGGDTGKQGPDLAGLSERRKIDWIVKFVKYPTGMIEGDEEEEGYEKADALAKEVYALYKPTMMSEQELETDQIKAIVKYIESQSKGKEPKGKIAALHKKYAKKK